MKKYTVLFNPYSGTNHGEEYAHELDILLKDAKLDYRSMPEVKNFKEFFKWHNKIIVCGGDGTLNYFVNKTKHIKYKNEILYFSTGSGNDFYNDVGNGVHIPFVINRYVDSLPTVSFNNEEHLFLNGAGFGMDGEICVQAEKLKKKQKKINYTVLALKNLATYKTRKAKVTIDGKEYNFDKVVMIPVMNGRYYGGGMKIAPDQDRLNSDHKLSVVICTRKSTPRLLLAFSKVFNGGHVKYKDIIQIYEGYDIKIEFDKPSSLQIDGEPYQEITTIHVKSSK